MAADIKKFKLPRYQEVPAIGLYLDQTAKYINEVFEPLGCVEVTPSMISNYVKKKYIPKPEKKLYNRNQITCLMFIALAKLALSMDNIDHFLKMESFNPISIERYNVFCAQFEQMILYVFGLGEKPDEVEKPADEHDRFIKSLLIAVSHYIYLNACFAYIQESGIAATGDAPVDQMDSAECAPAEKKTHREKPAARRRVKKA